MLRLRAFLFFFSNHLGRTGAVYTDGNAVDHRRWACTCLQTFHIAEHSRFCGLKYWVHVALAQTLARQLVSHATSVVRLSKRTDQRHFLPQFLLALQRRCLLVAERRQRPPVAFRVTGFRFLHNARHAMAAEDKSCKQWHAHLNVHWRHWHNRLPLCRIPRSRERCLRSGRASARSSLRRRRVT
jgi:hypothetical protein